MRDAWIYPYDPGIAETLTGDLAELGYTPRPLPLDEGPPVGRAAADRPPTLLVVVAGPEHAEEAAELCTALRGNEELRGVPLLLVVDPGALAGDALIGGDGLVVAPWSHDELRTRIGRVNHRLGLAEPGDVVRFDALEINLATYQVTVGGTPVDFTHMEYELLRFLATHPDRVYSREALLSRVWGYDFYGGTRTVDVHVRRVRAKLGAEHAGRIQTLRSVGYRFES